MKSSGSPPCSRCCGLCDRPGNPAKFLLLGSASPDLIRGVSETLAGRALFVQVAGFSIDEVEKGQQNRLWLRGGFPRAFLTAGDGAAGRWMEGFAATFLERDIPQLGCGSRRRPCAGFG